MTTASIKTTPPGSLGLPFVGETLDFVNDTPRFFAERRQKYGEVFTTHLLGAKTVVMIGPEANRWIFSGENKYLVNQWSYAIRQLLGERCVAMLNGAAHTQRRAQLAPSFKHEAMAQFVAEIERLAQRHLAEWAATPGDTNVVPRVRNLAFEIAAAFIFGTTAVDVPYLNRLFHDWTAGMFAVAPINLPFTRFGKALAAKNAMMTYLENIVRQRQRLAEQPFDILGELLAVRDEAGQPLDVTTVVHEIQLQLFAGHDTTVAATSNLMLQLAQHPAVLEKLRAEQEALADRTLTLDALRDMPYLGQVINEGLRVIPPIGGAFRVMTQDTEFGDFVIPKGWTVFFSPGQTHQGPPWTNPTRFDPERWGPDRAEHKQKNFAFVPFGGGPRMCLGQNFALVEMKLIMALLLRSHTWELVPSQDLTYDNFPFPLPRHGIWVRFGRRG